MKRVFFLNVFIAIAAFGVVKPPIESMREAIEFTWFAPSEPFMLGEILFFDCRAKNTSSDTAIVYELEAAVVRMDSIEPFVMVAPYEQKVNDTLAPGDTAHYRYILNDGPNWFYDPLRTSRSYEKEVGISCLPPGKYRLVYRRRWDVADSIRFEIVEPPATERALLDSLAEEYVAYETDKPKDAIEIGRRLAEMSSGSPYAARGLILARGVAWENDLCEDALYLDSLFWENFGQPSVRFRYLPYPGILRATGGVLGKCVPKEERSAYLDWLASRFPDPEMTDEIALFRRLFEGEVGCSTCSKASKAK